MKEADINLFKNEIYTIEVIEIPGGCILKLLVNNIEYHYGNNRKVSNKPWDGVQYLIKKYYYENYEKYLIKNGVGVRYL